MKTKMKLLSLALLGLGGLAFASVSAAACPAGPTAADGGAWSGMSNASGSLEINSPGLDSSDCRLDAKLTGNFGFASAFVSDNSPDNEARYRAQFLVNVDSLSGLSIAQIVRIFGADTSQPAHSLSFPVTLNLNGNVMGTQKVLNVITACESGVNAECTATLPLTASGVQTIEIDWVQGASGSLKVWLNNNNEASPDVSLSVDNSAWGGIDNAHLGLYGATADFRSNQLNNVVSFDTFDSRRTSFIGF